jgi:hypothetical protein
VNPIDYLHLQLELEGKSVIGDTCLHQLEVVPGEEMPLLLIAQLTGRKRVAYADEALDPILHEELLRRARSVHFPQIGPLLEFLTLKNIPFEVEHYKTYLIPAHNTAIPDEEVICLSREDLKVREFGFGDFAEKVFVIERNGTIASACVSARETTGAVSHSRSFCLFKVSLR